MSTHLWKLKNNSHSNLGWMPSNSPVYDHRTVTEMLVYLITNFISVSTVSPYLHSKVYSNSNLGSSNPH